MATSLDDLITGAYGNMIRTPDQLAARKQEILNATLPEYLRKFGQTTQAQNEASFGRGMGLSTYNAYQQALNTLMQNEGAANIENQAQQGVDQAQRAAVADAAGYVNADKNRAAQQSIAAGNQTVARQLQKMRGNQAVQSGLIGGAANIGSGVGGMAAKSLLSKGGSGNTPGEMWQNLKANLNDLTGSGATPAYPEIGSSAGASEMAANPGAYNAPTFDTSAVSPESSFPGFDMSQWGSSGSDALTYGGPGLDLSSLLSSTFNPDTSWVNF
jgi:hypothetical protein